LYALVEERVEQSGREAVARELQMFEFLRVDQPACAIVAKTSRYFCITALRVVRFARQIGRE